MTFGFAASSEPEAVIVDPKQASLVDTTQSPARPGEMKTAISEGMVGLLKEYYGRGPTGAKTYFQDDVVVCVLRGGFSKVEETLLEGGRRHAVIQQRMEFQETMGDRFTEIIERATGRPVIAFMSGNHQKPDLMCEVFVLGPGDPIEDPEDRPPEAAEHQSPREVTEQAGDEVPALVDRLRATGNLHALVAMLRDGRIGPERARAALRALGETDLELLVQLSLDSLIVEYVEDPGIAHQPNRELRPRRDAS